MSGFLLCHFGSIGEFPPSAFRRFAFFIYSGYDEDIFFSAFDAYLHFCSSRLAYIIQSWIQGHHFVGLID